MSNNDAQPLTWDVVNPGESEPRESIQLRDRNASSVGNNDVQPLTRDVVNLGETEPRESIPLRELDAHFPMIL